MLAIIIGAIALGTVVCAYVLPYIDAMSRLKGAFEWELTSDKVVQRHGDGRAVEMLYMILSRFMKVVVGYS